MLSCSFVYLFILDPVLFRHRAYTVTESVTLFGRIDFDPILTTLKLFAQKNPHDRQQKWQKFYNIT